MGYVEINKHRAVVGGDKGVFKRHYLEKIYGHVIAVIKKRVVYRVVVGAVGHEKLEVKTDGRVIFGICMPRTEIIGFLGELLHILHAALQHVLIGNSGYLAVKVTAGDYRAVVFFFYLYIQRKYLLGVLDP